MTIRRQTLEEWFTDYQLRALARRHHHLAFHLDVDVSRLTDAYAAAGRRAPMMAIVVKAAAVLAARRPEVNRAILRTPLGTRVVQFDRAHVNVPVAMERDGRRVVSATVVRDADTLDVDAVAEHLRAARERPLRELPITRALMTRENTPLQRCLLRARHFVAFSVPQAYAARGGGISVSGIVRAAPAGVVTRIPSFGPTAFTVCPGALVSEKGRTTLQVGIGYDHAAFAGADAVACADALGALLAEGDPRLFGPRAAASDEARAPAPATHAPGA